MNVRPELLHPKVLHKCAPARLKVAAWGLGDSNILVGWLQIIHVGMSAHICYQ